MLKIAVILLLLIVAPNKDKTPRAGVMVANEDHAVPAIGGPSLPAGTIVTLVTIDNPQQVSRAVITDRLADSEIMARHDVPAPDYAVTPTANSSVLPNLAVAIIGKLEFERRGSTVFFRSENSVNPISVRGCTSNEGLHLTLWNGEPLKSKRLWHMYFFLAYDVEPTCESADTQDGG